MVDLEFFLVTVRRLRISGSVREDWYRALAHTAKNGQSTREVIEKMEPNFAKIRHPMTPLIRELLYRLRGGGGATAGRITIGTELRGLVPSTESTLIHAGIEAGKAYEGFENAADVLANSGKLRNSILGALVSPAVQIAALMGVLLFMSFRLLPRFEASRPRKLWPADAQLLGTIADYSVLISAGVAALIAALVFFIVVVAPKWAGPRREWCDRNLPLFGLIAAANGATLLTTLAGFVGAGMDFTTAIQKIRENSTPYIRYQCEKLIGLLRKGERPEAALAHLAVIPPRYHWIISVYGMSGDASGAYKKIAGEMVARTQKVVTTLFGRVVSPLLMLMVAGMILWIYSSLFDIAESGSKRAALEPGTNIAAVFSIYQGA